MTLQATSNSIVITDIDGSVVFDTNEGLFQATNFVTGTIVIPQRTSQYSTSNSFDSIIDQYTALSSSINVNCDTVIGAFSISTGGIYPGVSGSGWFNASGSYVHAIRHRGFSQQEAFHRNIGGMAVYTFEVANGTLNFHEQTTWLRPIPPFSGVTVQYIVNQTTMDYKLYCGSFV